MFCMFIPGTLKIWMFWSCNRTLCASGGAQTLGICSIVHSSWRYRAVAHAVSELDEVKVYFHRAKEFMSIVFQLRSSKALVLLSPNCSSIFYYLFPPREKKGQCEVEFHLWPREAGVHLETMNAVVNMLSRFESQTALENRNEIK